MDSLFLLGLLLFLFLVGVAWIYWFVRYGLPKGSPVLLYHKVDSRMEWGGTWNTPKQFERQMRFLREEGYTVVPLEDIVVGAGLKPAPTTRKLVAITFDDGYENLFHYAYPILKQYGYPATIFLITGFIGEENLWDVNVGMRRFRHLSWDEIIEMKENGFTFGSHTVTHRDLTKIPLEEVRWELAESKRSLKERIGEEIKFLSYPFGRYSEEIQGIAKETGYTTAFTSYPRTKNSFLDPFARRRVGIYIIDTLPEIRIKMDGSNPLLYGIEEIKGRVINLFSHGTPLYKNVKLKIQNAKFNHSDIENPSREDKNF